MINESMATFPHDHLPQLKQTSTLLHPPLPPHTLDCEAGHGPDLVVQHDVVGAEAARQVPGEVHHGNDGLVVLQLVVLVALHGQPVLLVGHGADVPGNVVAPALHTRVKTEQAVRWRVITAVDATLSLCKRTKYKCCSLSLSLQTHTCTAITGIQTWISGGGKRQEKTKS